MTPLRILATPELHEPTLIVAFAGWSDAGSAATAAAQYLTERWRAVRLAEIDAEEFFDFTQLRPTVRYEGEVRRIDWPENAFHYHETPKRHLIIFKGIEPQLRPPVRYEGEVRRIDWPENAFHYHETPKRHLIIFKGIEPHLRWKTYTEAMLEVIDRFQVKLVVGLNALNADYPHTRPTRITGTAPDPDMLERAGIQSRGNRRYEGPTGIHGVLNVALQDRDIPSASIWANVPHYVQATPNPPATLALLKSLMAMLEVEVPLSRMQRAALAFDAQLNDATAKNTEVSDYVRILEERFDAEVGAPAEGPAELPATEIIVKDIEDFLRQRSGEGD